MCTHACKLIYTARITTKYSQMKPPIKNLIRGVKSCIPGSICSNSQLEWWAVERDQKSPPRTSRTHEREQNSCFWRERDREEEEIPAGGACGPQAPCGRSQEAGRARRLAAPAGRLRHLCPLVIPRCFWFTLVVEIFIFIFLDFFLKTSLLKKIRSSKSCETFWKLEAVIWIEKFQKHMNLVQQRE